MNEIITLPNGLRLAYQNIPYVHSVSLGVFVKIGSRNELDTDNGIAHFTEHVLFKGTEKRTAFDIVKEMDSLGANMNAFTSSASTTPLMNARRSCPIFFCIPLFPPKRWRRSAASCWRRSTWSMTSQTICRRNFAPLLIGAIIPLAKAFWARAATWSVLRVTT